jgi:hypothetical protein
MTAVERCLFVLRQAALKPGPLVLYRDLVVFRVVRAEPR